MYSDVYSGDQRYNVLHTVHKNPSTSFNIRNYISFSVSNTQSSTHHKLHHSISSTNYQCHFYLNRIPTGLWNSLPPIDFSSSPNAMKAIITKYLWSHFESNFNLTNPYSFTVPAQTASHHSIQILHSKLQRLPVVSTVMPSTHTITYRSF